MDESIVFRRTPKAQAELEGGQPSLSSQSRQLLVFVDGRRTVADLALLLSALGNVQQMLLELLAGGFLTTTSSIGAGAPAGATAQAQPLASASLVVAQLTRPPAAAQTEPALAPPPERPADPAPGVVKPPEAPITGTRSGDAKQLEVAKSRIVDEMRELMGKDVDLVATRVLRCSSAAELALVVAKLKDVVVKLSSVKRGDEFLALCRRLIEPPH